MSRVLLVVLLLPVHQSAPALEVLRNDGRVTVRAQAVRLKEVLERLSEETGVRVVYEGPEPSPIITVLIEDQPEPEAIRRILEGLGLNHAIQMDASGHRVEMVIIDETVGSGPSTSTTQGRPATRTYPRPPLPPEPPESGGLEDPGLAEDPSPGADESPDAEYLAPGSRPAYAAEGVDDDRSEPMSPDLEPPQIPAEASSPPLPGSVPLPVFPGTASQP